MLRDTERCEALVEHADQLVVMFSMKLRMTYGKHLSPDDTPGVEDSLKSYRSLFATLVSVSTEIGFVNKITYMIYLCHYSVQFHLLYQVEYQTFTL